LTVKLIPASADILNTSLCTKVLDKDLSDAIVNWESIVHKNVRSRDGQDAGNVDAIMGDIVVITTQGDRREYNLPKTQVEGFNGAEVFLKNTLDELEAYRV
jgi:hypothetical protein